MPETLTLTYSRERLRIPWPSLPHVVSFPLGFTRTSLLGKIAARAKGDCCVQYSPKFRRGLGDPIQFGGGERRDEDARIGREGRCVSQGEMGRKKTA